MQRFNFHPSPNKCLDSELRGHITYPVYVCTCPSDNKVGEHKPKPRGLCIARPFLSRRNTRRTILNSNIPYKYVMEPVRDTRSRVFT